MKKEIKPAAPAPSKPFAPKPPEPACDHDWIHEADSEDGMESLFRCRWCGKEVVR